MELPDSIEITEVGPRDGLQNQSAVLSTDTKVAFIDSLSRSGLARIEVSSFVSPKWVPQLSDAAEVFSLIHRQKGVSYTAIVPNEQGWQSAINAGVNEIAIMTGASETFCNKNINTTIAGSIEKVQPIVEQAHLNGIKVRGYVSCAIACPYEGEIGGSQVRTVIEQLLHIGVNDISLGDTIGVAVPSDIERLYGALAGVLTPEQSILHLHDTRGTALACAVCAMQLGVCRFDTSCGGLGGCPYAPGASGNLATEDLVYLANRMGIETGVDLDAVLEATKCIAEALETAPNSRVYSAFNCQDPSFLASEN